MMSKRAPAAEDEYRATPTSTDRDPEFEQIRKAVKGIRFGEVRVIIQDGIVVQIERIEKQRLR
jgi:hypothetical protein